MKPDASVQPFKAHYSKPKVLAPIAPIVSVPSKDVAILEYILQMRYLSIKQIAKRFFNTMAGPDAVAAGIVMEEFVKSGLLQTKVTKTSETIFLATTMAREYITKENPNKNYAQITRQVFMPRVKHDLLLADLRVRFEELNFVTKWYPEALLKEVPLFLREFQNLPDAICKKPNGMAYFLELEVSMKSLKVYSERIQEYTRILAKDEIKEASIEGVIFFCTDEKVQEKIKSLIPKTAKNISVLRYDTYFVDGKGKANA